MSIPILVPVDHGHVFLGAGYASKYTHQDETAKAGYYSVIMKRYNIRVELTATERVAVHKYTFPQAEQAHIAINLTSGIG